MSDDTLHLAELRYDTGERQAIYERRLSDDGAKWVRHGLFRAYYRNGHLASEGHYVNGREEGVWRDYHENGKMAAQGTYRFGKEHGHWRYWNEIGQLEGQCDFLDGVEQPEGQSGTA